MLRLDWEEGSDELLTNLAPDEAVIDKQFADDNGLEVGATFDGGHGQRRRGDADGRRHVHRQQRLHRRLRAPPTPTRRPSASPNRRPTSSSTSSPEPTPARCARRSRPLLEQQFPTVQVQDQEELKDSIAEQLNALLGIIYVLLALSVIVSLFGIVNTLALTIHERTRELGLLRAVGTSRRQIRRMVRYEAVITALIGGVLGLVLGVLFAVLVSRPLADEGFTLSIPIGQLIGLLVLAALAGVIAAIGPARRASRLDVLEALAYE